MRSRRALALLGALLAILGAGAGRAEASLTVGLGDQTPAWFSDPRLRALHLPVARLIVPYDAATSQPAQVDSWLAAVAAAGMQPHVAFEHLRSDHCPGQPCTLPSRATYAGAVRRFIARWPQVRTYTTWNEANHSSQPVWNQPERVAGYYEDLLDACPGCTIVAGDVLDSGNYVQWLRRFDAATTTDPQLWGLHNYGDVTYSTTTGTDAVLATVPGKLWIEETGGIVVLRNPAGRQTLSYDETRAAAGIDQAFAIAAARPRITRMYLYHWRTTATSPFDSGLARPDGTLRPSYHAAVRGLQAIAAATPAPVASTTVAATIRWTVAWAPGHRTLVLRANCLTSGGRCTGSVTATVLTRRRAGTAATAGRPAARQYSTRSGARTETLHLSVTRSLRRRLRLAHTRRLRLAVLPSAPAAPAATISLRLARP